MTKEEAIIEMHRCNKVTHRHFSNDEWVTMRGDKMLFEDGVQISPNQFWIHRTDQSWNTDWELFNPTT